MGGYVDEKLFATSFEDAYQFGRINFSLDKEPFHIIRVKAPDDLMNNFFHFEADGMPAIILQILLSCMENNLKTFKARIYISDERKQPIYSGYKPLLEIHGSQVKNSVKIILRDQVASIALGFSEVVDIWVIEKVFLDNNYKRGDAFSLFEGITLIGNGEII